MKTYIGTKTVSAQPMSAKEALNNNYKIGDHKEDEDGYEVMYEDGYISWSPKDVFEKAYKIADTFIDRLKIELSDLSDKQDKLNKFFETKMFKDLSITDEHLLRAQFGVMVAYSNILTERISKAEYEWEHTWKIVMPDERKSTNLESTK